MGIEFTPRLKTDRIVVHVRRNQPDMGIYNLDIMQRRSNRRPDSGYHFVIRHNADIEKGRPHDVVGGFFPNCIDINIICKGDDMDELQTLTLNSLVNHLNLIYPEAQLHYA
jgi:hypothetical protein